MPDNTIHASAPGKLLISGEYAVLEGATAISLAVDRRVNVMVEPLPNAGDGIGELVAIDADQNHYSFSWGGDGSLTFDTEPEGRGALLKSALLCMAEYLPQVMPAVRITVDSSGFYARQQQGGNVKLGLGSSAAVCVALTGALAKLFRISGDMQKLALRVHKEFQNKAGSGVDVVNSYQGGLIAYRRTPEMKSLSCPHLSWPEGLHMLPVWTGQAASTTKLLAGLEQFKVAEPLQFNEAMDELQQANNALAEMWQKPSGTNVLDGLALVARKLKDFDRVTKTGIYSAGHLEFQKRAAAMGAVYKPSGAGGGDFGLLFTDSSATLEQLWAEFKDESILKDWSATARGLYVDRSSG